MSDVRKLAFMEAVRLELRDFGGVNTLLGSTEHGDLDIEYALTAALGEVNDTVPTTSYTFSDIPNRSLLIQGAVFRLLRSAVRVMARSELDGAKVGYKGQIAMYSQERDATKAEFYGKLAALKQQLFDRRLCQATIAVASPSFEE